MSSQLTLQLGDIIKILSPSDDNIHIQEFLIQYIDKEIIELIGRKRNTYTLYIREDGSLTNESIVGIELTYRDDSPSYAIQHRLLPNQWIDIYFEGDLPVVVTGIIQQLEEDQIEIKLTDSSVIYIDFAYKGIPKDIPLSRIVLRDAPTESSLPSSQAKLEVTEPSEEVTEQIYGLEEIDDTSDLFRDRIKDVLLSADQIQFGDTLGSVDLVIEVPQEERRYGIERQMTDLLNEMLSVVPNTQRTPHVMNDIHRILERFQQLRLEYSKFDSNGNASRLDESIQKPLVASLNEFSHKLHWIIPVSKQKKKVYDVDEEVEGLYDDISMDTLASSRLKETEWNQLFREGNLPNGQNNYNYMMKHMNTQWTPYEPMDEPNTELFTVNVHTNIMSYLDNLGDFYTSMVQGNDIHRQRFVPQIYMIGMDTMETKRIGGGHTIMTKKNIIPSDTIQLKSFITLPYSTVTFSRINTPLTKLITKCNMSMHYIAYWTFLHKKSSISMVPIDNPVLYDANTYFKTMTEYVRNEDSTLTYDDYLDRIIPTTELLIQTLRAIRLERYTTYSLIEQLEPFLIYHKHISFQHYSDILGLLTDKTNQWKRDYSKQQKEYKKFIPKVPKSYVKPKILNLYKGYDSENKVEEGYNVQGLDTMFLSTSEWICRTKEIDDSRYFHTSIAQLNSDLMVPSNAIELLTQLETVNPSVEDATDTSCQTRVLSKQYNTKEDMLKDNEQPIRYDTKYDKTYYDILKEYKSKVEVTEDPSEKQLILSQLLRENTNMTVENANRDSEAMILGYRPVKEGDYAVWIDDTVGMKYYYYVRQNNIWVRDETISDDINADTNSMFCDVSSKCISIQDKCKTTSSTKIDFQRNDLKAIIKEFEDSVLPTLDEMKSFLNQSTLKAQSRLVHLQRIHSMYTLRYDQKMYEYGLDAKEVEEYLSPYSNVLQLILSQSDFVKRQTDITKFVAHYTRPYIELESQWWLYCIVTGVKLLPIFISNLANVFINGEDYFDALQHVASLQGTLGGDGEAIVDKYSGWVITYIDFNTEEGYTEEGFVIRSREILAADLGQSVIQNQITKKNNLNPETEKISKVGNAICQYIGVNWDIIQPFVLKETSKLLSNQMPAKTDYEKAVATKGKKEPYEFVYDQTLILMTTSYVLIGIQTNTQITLFNKNKTYPSCVKSFAGYPTHGNGDKSGIEYIACIVNAIKSSVEPWNALKKMNVVKLVTKMEAIINTFILPTDMMQDRIRVKLEYELTQKPQHVPISNDILQWNNFLPPLRPVKVVTQPITEAYQTQLISDIKKGHVNQFDRMDTIRSKIIFLALSLEMSIQTIVSKNIKENQAVLLSNQRIPYLENACCNDNLQTTFDYFNSIDPTIERTNRVIHDLRKALDDITAMSKAAILFDTQDTRIHYPDILSTFDEETIYKAFIHYCNFNSTVPLNEALRAICMDNSTKFKANSTLQEKISMLKQDGKQYNLGMLHQLLEVIHKTNQFTVQMQTFEINPIQKIIDRITYEQDHETTLPEPFIKHMLDVLHADGKDVNRELKNYLATTNDLLLTSLSDFIRRNSNTKTHTSFMKYITELLDLNTETNLYNLISVMKNNIHNMVRVYPNIILNKVKYDNVRIPACWNLSEKHQNDLKLQTMEHFKPLHTFYNDSDIEKFMRVFQTETQSVVLLAMDTMCYESNKDNVPFFERRTTQLLYKFYLLHVCTQMVSLVSREEFYNSVVQRPSNPLLSASQLGQETGEIEPLLEMTMGEKQTMSEKMSQLITGFLSIGYKEQTSVNISYDDLMDKVVRSKEKEKDGIVEYLTELTTEEREIENMFKNFRIGRWSVGMQKGYRQYDGDTYDQERTDIENRAILESKLKRVDGVTEGLMDVFALDEMMQQKDNEFTEQQELTIEYNGEDNNINDNEYERYM
uniref:Uncharacterized protein n=1 Tax=viral metagenome TaxID=1070528 RepID=A0A6C0JWI0_9ZZZZ